MPTPVQMAVDPARLARRVFVCCLTLEVAFVLLDYHVNYGRLTEIGAVRRLSNIAREDGLASWFATTQTLLVGLTAWGLWLLARSSGASQWRQAGWFVVAGLFTYMAVDDGAQVHERLGTVVSVLGDGGQPPGVGSFPSYAWQVLFVPIFGVLGLGLASFLWRELDDRVGLVLVASALSCFAVAVGLDFIEGLDEEHPWNLYTWVTARVDFTNFAAARFGQTPYDTLEHFSRSLEESLEMLANTFMWVTFVRHAPSITTDVHIRLARSRS